MDIYLCTDQPETCRKCGTRTHIIHDFEEDGVQQQIHKCPNCGYRYQLDCDWEVIDE